VEVLGVAGYRSTRRYAVVAVVAAAAVALSEVLRAVAAHAAVDRFTAAAQAGVSRTNIYVPYDIYAPYDVHAPYNAASASFSVSIVAAYIATCLWLLEARTQSELLTTERPRRARGWIWAGWLVPIVSFWFPLQIVRDIRNAADLGRQGPRRGPATGLWWALWLAFTFVVQSGLPQSIGTEVGRQVFVHFAIDRTNSAVLAVAAFAVWAPLVMRISGELDEAAARSGLTPPPAAAAGGSLPL